MRLLLGHSAGALADTRFPPRPSSPLARCFLLLISHLRVQACASRTTSPRASSTGTGARTSSRPSSARATPSLSATCETVVHLLSSRARAHKVFASPQTKNPKGLPPQMVFCLLGVRPAPGFPRPPLADVSALSQDPKRYDEIKRKAAIDLPVAVATQVLLSASAGVSALPPRAFPTLTPHALVQSRRRSTSVASTSTAAMFASSSTPSSAASTRRLPTAISPASSPARRSSWAPT